MNLVQFGKRILSLGPKGTPQHRLTNVDDPKTDFDAVNLKTLKSYGGGGSKPNFNLDIQIFSYDNDGIPLVHNGGIWGNFGSGPEFFEIFIDSEVNEVNLFTFYLDRFNCNSEILVEATGPYVSEMAPDSGTSWTVSANSSVLGTAIGFTTPGQKEITFVATACGVSKSVTIFFNVFGGGGKCYPMYNFDIDLFSKGAGPGPGPGPGAGSGYVFGLGGDLFNDMIDAGHPYDISFLAVPVGGGASSSYDYQDIYGSITFPCNELSPFNSYEVTITVTNLDLGCTYCITQTMSIIVNSMPIIYTMYNCGGGSGIGSGGSGGKNAAPIGGKYLKS